jgi:RNA polymerase sigma-70 factor, ECF subfamily
LTDIDLLRIHLALLKGDPTAPREFVHECAPRLYPILKRRFALLPRDVVEDAVHDALLAIIARPALYDARRGSLINLLVHVGTNRLCDQLRTLKRRQAEMAVGGTVELARFEAKYLHENADADPELDPLPPEVEALLAEILPDPKDRAVWDLVCQGRTPVEEFAAVLELDDLPPERKKAEVKRHRDRVVKKVQRRREEFREYLS